MWEVRLGQARLAVRGSILNFKSAPSSMLTHGITGMKNLLDELKLSKADGGIWVCYFASLLTWRNVLWLWFASNYEGKHLENLKLSYFRIFIKSFRKMIWNHSLKFHEDISWLKYSQDSTMRKPRKHFTLIIESGRKLCCHIFDNWALVWPVNDTKMIKNF